jgi:hypothetical protein
VGRTTLKKKSTEKEFRKKNQLQQNKDCLLATEQPKTVAKSYHHCRRIRCQLQILLNHQNPIHPAASNRVTCDMIKKNAPDLEAVRAERHSAASHFNKKFFVFRGFFGQQRAHVLDTLDRNLREDKGHQFNFFV